MVQGTFGIQIIGILFGFFMMYYTFLHYKRKELNGKEYSLWIVVWGIFIIMSLFPDILTPITRTLNIARIMDLFIIIGFMFLVGLSFYTYSIVRKNEKRIEELVRKTAFKK